MTHLFQGEPLIFQQPYYGLNIKMDFYIDVTATFQIEYWGKRRQNYQSQFKHYNELEQFYNLKFYLI